MSGTKFSRTPWSRKVSVIAALTAILVAGGLVFFTLVLNQQMSSKQPVSEQSSLPQVPEVPFGVQARNNTPYMGELLNVDQLMGVPSYFERSIALDNLLARASIDDCLKLLDESKKLTEMGLRNWTQQEIFRKLATIDPEAALVHTHDFLSNQRVQLVQAVFQEWAFSNFEAAVDYGEKYVQDVEYRESQAVLYSILQTKHDLSDDVRRQIGNRFGQEQFVVQMTEHEAKSALVENPINGWLQLLMGTESNLGESEEFLEVALSVIEKEGFDTFARLHRELPDRRSRTEILRRVLRARIEVVGYQWVFEKAVELIDVSSRSIVFRIAEDWARRDIDSTLGAVARVANDDLRKYLRESVAIAWAERNPQRMLDNPISLPVSLRNTAEYTALFELAVKDPPTATKYLDRMSDWESAEFSGSQIDPSIRRSSVVNSLMGNWASRDTEGAYEWLLASSESEESRDSLFFIDVLNQVSVANAEALVNVAMKYPIDAIGAASEGAIVASVARIDISTARNLVASVRDRASRINAHAAIGAALLKEDSNPNSSLEYAEELPQSDRAEYFLRLGGHWALESPKDAFKYIERLPSEEARSYAAFSLTQSNGWRQVLSEQQVEQLRPLLTEEQLDKLKE